MIFRSELEDRFTKLSPPLIVVNIWRSKNQPWSVANAETHGIEFLEKIKDLVIGLPLRVSLPEHLSEWSFPRYYAIYYDPYSNEIKDIIGVRNDLTATKWSYKFGYWHPKIQQYIAKAIEEELKELRKQQKPLMEMLQ